MPSLNNSIVVIAYRGKLQEEQIDEDIRNAIRSVGIGLDFNNSNSYIAILADGILVDQFQMADLVYVNDLLGHQLEIVADAQNTLSVLADNVRITKVNQEITENAFQIYVYDIISGKVIEKRTLNL